MFHGLHAGARSRVAGLLSLVFAAGLLSACGSDDAPSSPPAAQAPASRLIVDTGTAAPAQGGTLTLKATLLGADGLEVKGARFAWSSSSEAVAVVVSASDQAPAAASMMQPVGAYASVRMLAPGEVDIVATATLPDGSQATSTTHLTVQPPAAKSYTLTLSPALLTVTAGGAAQPVAVAVRRSDGVDGAADLANWSWTSDDATFVVTAAADGHAAQVASPASAVAAGAATLTACADAPAGARLCANAALARAAAPPPPTYTLGGTLAGLATGKSLQLADSNGDTLVVNANGSFSLPTPRTAASAYAVTVSGQPAGQTCTVSNGSGTMAGANVTSIAIACVQAQFVVVANRDDSTLSVYRTEPASGTLTAVPGSPFAAAGQVRDIAFLPSGLVGYTIATDTASVVGFRLDPASGVLSVIPGATATVPFGAPGTIAVHPSGKWIHVGGPGVVSSFAIDAATFVPSMISAIPAPTSPGATTGFAISQDGISLYAINAVQDSVWQIGVNAGTGSLESLSIAAPAGSQPNGAVLSGNGAFLYMPYTLSNLVGVASISSGTGAPLFTSIFTTEASPTDIALTPSGEFTYVLGSASNSIAAYRLDGVTGLPVAALGTTPVGSNGQRLRIDPNGRFLYTPAFNGAVYGFRIDAVTGALTAVPGSPFAAGNGNTAIAIVQPLP